MRTDEVKMSPRGAVASARHTVGLLVAMLVLSVSGAIRSPILEWPDTLALPNARLILYAKILLFQWLWAGYVWFGMSRSASSMRALIDDSRWSVRRWLRYLTVGVAGLVVWLVLSAAVGGILRPSAEQLRGVQAMLPHAPVESVLWVGFALSAALCEEVVYRGYLFRQFRAWTGSTAAAILLQAGAYGLAHLALPIEMVVSVSLLGLLLGVLAVWQKSLIPGMILHSGTGLMAILASGR